MHGIDINLEKALHCPVNISISAQRIEAGIFKAVLLTLGKVFFPSRFPPSCQFSQILLPFGVKYTKWHIYLTGTYQHCCITHNSVLDTWFLHTRLCALTNASYHLKVQEHFCHILDVYIHERFNDVKGKGLRCWKTRFAISR